MSKQTEVAPLSVWEATHLEPQSPALQQTSEALLTIDTADPRRLASLWLELRTLREELEASHASESRLQAELEAAEKALEYTKGEVANLWRAMTTRNLKEAARKVVAEARHDSRLVRLSAERARIQGKITDIRSLARRRRWPWSLVG